MTERLEYLFLLFPVAGVVLLLGGISHRRRLKPKLDACLQTWGTVVGSVESPIGGLDPTPVYRPVVEYSVGDQRYSVTSDIGYGCRLEAGARIPVRYDPMNPSTAFVGQHSLIAAHLMLAMGGVFVLMGALIAYCILWRGN